MGLLTQALGCPWCESRGPKGESYSLWVWDKGVPGRFAIGCSNPHCAATGPISDTEAEAVVKWNAAPRRPGQERPAVRQLLDEAVSADAERELDPRHGRPR